ncbi:protein RecA [Ruminococcus sp. CAG:579]|uniref:recombinase RecA n=1 Tax=Ruminococcus sp. 210702-SL.1.03 TaxID=2883233 RepID=UPI00033F3F69|nr:recombinase RecA [Ruminococcus sp. 210702-SL.1.03]MCB6615966.1 recombinase RecA [Ruminococcus sp. 210702-SL.1.03]CDA74050.1 protein RecA [Ruminococcus sp. CAG:579]
MAIDKKKKEKPQVKRITDAEEKKKALETAISVIEQKYGKGAIMKLGSNSTMDIEAIPTGSMTLDLALGIGGIPRGRIVELYGPESSGKTTVALHCIAETQKMGGEVAFIDVEHALDPVYAAKLGVDIDNLLVSQPDSGEQALEIAEALARSGAIDCIVIDSVAAMVTKAEIDGDMGDTHVGQLARLMSQAMRKLTAVLSKSNCAAIFINQIREKIGVIYGNPETTPGGRALKFYASVRMDVRKGEAIKNGSEIIGNRTRVKIVKNKVAPPFKECEFDIMYGEGISRTGEVLDLAVDLGVVKKGGAWFSYNDEKLGQGRDNAKIFLKEHPDTMKEIEEKIKVRLAEEEQKQAEKKASKKKSKLEEKAAAAAGVAESAEPAESEMPDLVVNADEDFEEFAPVDISNLGE